MRHATEADLDHIEVLLAKLRDFPQLRERQRGSFSRGPRAFLHFHAEAADFYVDVRLSTVFERMKVTSEAEQAEFLAQVRKALTPAPPVAAPGNA